MNIEPTVKILHQNKAAAMSFAICQKKYAILQKATLKQKREKLLFILVLFLYKITNPKIRLVKAFIAADKA